MKTFAFVFARGGSKGLPRKNIKPLAGKPLLLYSIELAKRCTSIAEVFVSTEDHEIAHIAHSNGAIVIERPAELAADSSPEWLSWRHAVKWVNERYGFFDIFVSLPTTSPLRIVEDVDESIDKIKNNIGEICISITPADRNPFFNMVKTLDDGSVNLASASNKSISQRQEAPKLFNITTVVYATTPNYILTRDRIFDGKVTSIEVPKNRAVDIDDIYDFKLAEVMIKESLFGKSARK